MQTAVDVHVPPLLTLVDKLILDRVLARGDHVLVWNGFVHMLLGDDSGAFDKEPVVTYLSVSKRDTSRLSEMSSGMF